MKELLELLSEYIFFEKPRRTSSLNVLKEFLIWSRISKFDEFMKVDRKIIVKFQTEKGLENRHWKFRYLVSTVNHIASKFARLHLSIKLSVSPLSLCI